MAKIPLRVTKKGLYCPPADFFIDAWSPVPVCLVTHAHGDHAYPGHGLYIATEETIQFMRHRMGNLPTQAVKYNQRFQLGSCWVSFHPAGHILGSAQIRIEQGDCVTVISGDYKRSLDGSCTSFEVVPCDFFVTESTFALPIYQWPSNEELASQIKHWWQENAAEGRPSVLFCYPLGKAQRILSLLGQIDKPVYMHGATYSLSKIYQELGVDLGPFKAIEREKEFSEALILAPPLAAGSPWMRRFPACRTALASGWMQVRGMRRRQVLDRGFILSDHVDWKGILKTIEETQAKIVLTTHGNGTSLARYLKEKKNLHAHALEGLVDSTEDEDLMI